MRFVRSTAWPGSAARIVVGRLVKTTDLQMVGSGERSSALAGVRITVELWCGG